MNGAKRVWKFQSVFGIVWSVLLDLNAFLCSLNLCVKLLSVCPTYTLLQSEHVSLYAPDLLYLSRVWGFGISSFWRVLLVCSVILRSVFLKRFVIKVVSLRMYVKGAHFCVVLSVFRLGVMVCCLREGAMCVCGPGIHCSAWCRGWCPVLPCIRHFAGGKCSACYIGTLRQHACVGVGGSRNMG